MCEVIDFTTAASAAIVLPIVNRADTQSRRLSAVVARLQGPTWPRRKLALKHIYAEPYQQHPENPNRSCELLTFNTKTMFIPLSPAVTLPTAVAKNTAFPRKLWKSYQLDNSRSVNASHFTKAVGYNIHSPRRRLPLVREMEITKVSLWLSEITQRHVGRGRSLCVGVYPANFKSSTATARHH